jgi:predicted unusual protein kinase regulating ubiquinone biosynthesis (AarF/ABC1/UbiB family)
MMGLFFRFLRILLRLVPSVALMIRDYYQSLAVGRAFDWDSHARRRRARTLVRRLASLGPTYIKLAQVLAARADLFPGIYLDELRQLHDHVPAASRRVMRRHFRRITGKRPDEVFDEFTDTPIASASLGEVHEAIYHGQRVAVKILRPGIRKNVNKDIRVLSAVYSIITMFFQNPQIDSLITVFEQFSRHIHDEMDLELEAEHIRDFRKRYHDDDRVRIPEVIGDLSNRDLLVMEFIDGIKITEAEQLRDAGHDTHAIINSVLILFGEMILRHGVFHADPHPGNIFVDKQGRIVLLDFGLVLEVTERQRKDYIQTVLAVVRGDVEVLIEKAIELGTVSADTNPLILRQAARKLMTLRLRDDLGPIEFQRLAMQITDVFYEFPLHMPAELVFIFKTATLIEGIGARYQAGYNLLKDGREIVNDLLRPEIEAIDVEQQVVDKVMQEGREAIDLYQNLKMVIGLAAREELAIRLYRGDIAEFERIVGYTVRRLIGMAFAFGAGITGGMIFLATGVWWPALLGGIASVGGLIALILMPNVPRTPRIVRGQRGPD